jgi:uncharacterized repeat protein (TIGR01451 family)
MSMDCESISLDIRLMVAAGWDWPLHTPCRPDGLGLKITESYTSEQSFSKALVVLRCGSHTACGLMDLRFLKENGMNGWSSRTSGTNRVRRRSAQVAALAAILAMASTASAAPTITSVSPNVGAGTGGTRVTLTGTAFSTASGATRISFGNKSGTAVSCPRTFLCQVTAPSGTGAVNVTATFAGTSTDTAIFRYAPAITRINPGAGDAVANPAVRARIDGQGFVVGQTAFVFGGVRDANTGLVTGGVAGINPVCSSTTSCQVTVPDNLSGAGVVDVWATAPVQTTPGGAVTALLTSFASTSARYSYTVPAGTPIVTSITPGSGPATVGTPVTINGTGFSVTTGAPTVRFGGTRAAGGTLATNLSCTSTIRCTATAPPGIGTVDVWVKVGALTSFLNAGAKFTYLDPPTITTLTPNNGSQSGGNVITIDGTNFVLDGTTFRFGTLPAVAGTCDAATRCTVTVPASPTFGVVQVAAVAGGQTGPGANYTYNEPPNPVITSVTPARGTVTGGATVTITGAKLRVGVGVSVVRFGGTPAPIAGGNCSLTQCVVTVPAHAVGPVDITVTTSAGANVNTVADDFTYFLVNNEPPFPGHSILSFTQRDFVSVDGFSASDAPYTISVIRNGSVISAVPNMTPDAAGLMEINHPGGSCWVGQTPDIVPGDVIRVTGQSGISEQTTTAGVKANKAIEVTGVAPAITVKVHGSARNAAGNQIPIGEIEQRFVVLDPKAKFLASGRRTMRAFDGGVGPADGSLAYDAPGSVNWTATYVFDNQADVDLARIGSESRIMWLGTDPAAGVEATIYEVGADVFGGPQAPCTTPWELDGLAPTTPGSFTAARDADPNGDNVTLTWTASTDNREVTGYRVYRDGSLIATVAGDKVTYKDLHRAIGTYTYRVSAIDLAGNESAQTAPRTATTGASLAPDLSVTKTHVGDAFRIGQAGQYQLVVTNAGTFSAVGTFTVTDDLPAGITLQGAVSSASGTGPALSCGASTSTQITCNSSGGVTWNQGASKTITFSVAVAAEAAGEVENTATVAFVPSIGNPADSVDANDSSTDAVIVDVGTPDTIGAPPAGSRGIIAFPGRDFVSGEGYDPTDRLTVQVLRDSGSGYQVIAQSRLQQPGADGILEINHPGGGCWSGDPQHATGNPAAAFPYTPNIRPGDKIRYISGKHGYADETIVHGVNNGRPYNPAPGVIRYHGTAQDANGDPLPIDRVVARLVAGTGLGLFHHGTGARRSIEATNPAGEGSLSYDAPGSINWTAEFTGLDQHDVDLALVSEARTLFLGGDALAGNDITIYERGANPGDVEKGPSAPCGGTADPGTGVAPSVATNPRPELTIESTHSGDFQVGTPNTYTLNVTNAGNATATANAFTPIKVIDYLPAGIGYLGTTSGPAWTCSAAGQKVTCDRTTAIGQGVTVPLVLQVSVGNAAVPSATNVVTVSGPRDFESPNNRNSDDTVVNPFVAPAPDLTIEISHSRRFTVGSNDNSYLIKVTNGLGPATPGPTTSAIRVVDTLPTGMTYKPAGSGGVDWTCAAVGQDVTCDYAGAALADDAGAGDLRIFVDVAAAALQGEPVTNTANNTATVSTADGEELVSTRSDNTAIDPTVVRNNPSAPDVIDIIVFPSRDFVSISGFDMGSDLVDPNDGDGQVRVQVWRNGGLVSQSGLMTPEDDPTTPEADGIVDINHVGVNDCWTGVTPDIRPGDIVRTVDARGVSYEVTVQNARADAAQAIDTNGDSVNDTVVIHGIATDAAGNRLSDDAFGNLEQRIIKPAGGPGFAIADGRRALHAPGEGLLTREAGSIGWTATYTFPALLDADGTNDAASIADIAAAVAGETRILASPNLLAGNDITIFETGGGTDGGPAVAGCPPAEAPEADLGVAIAAAGGAVNTSQTATVTVANNGPNNAVNTVVTLALPAGVTNVTSDGGAVAISGRVARVSIPSLTNVPVTITVTYTPTTTGTHVLAASTQSDSADPHPVSPGTDMVAARIAVI